MSRQSTAWRQEIERRISQYEEIVAKGTASGRLGRGDYLGLAALIIVLITGFWSWGGV